MLRNLLIKNYALIQSLEMLPAQGLNVITGETGAGKSIMLGAVGLLLGNRAETKVLLHDDEKCVVEGEFDIKAYNLKSFFGAEDLEHDDITVIRREISASGKSRAFVNDSPVTLDILRRLGQRLMDVHSQHENLELGKGLYQLNLIDNFAGNKPLLEDYTIHYKSFRTAEKSYKKLTEQADQLRQEADYNRFLLKELEEASLQDLDQEALENDLAVLENAEEIKSSFHQANIILKDGEFTGINAIAEAKSLLQQVSRLSEKYKTLAERLESIYIELDDAANEVYRHMEAVEFNPQETEVIRERLSRLYQLQKKHNVLSVQELRKIEADLAEKVTTTDNLDDQLAAEKATMEKAQVDLEASAKNLSESRKAVASSLSGNIEQLLSQLGMPNARIQVAINDSGYMSHGNDEINILFSANKGFAPQPIQKVASGGEFSRLIFCIKYILAKKMALPTIVFDEIDTGVSGEIAMKLAEMMKEMSRNHQVITISHSPQIAARGNAHYFVFKDEEGKMTTSRIRLLDQNERISEIAKMIGGDNPPAAALESAKTLLQVS
jgi:DNA repair protein RecN (Recombination protein N)